MRQVCSKWQQLSIQKMQRLPSVVFLGLFIHLVGGRVHKRWIVPAAAETELDLLVLAFLVLKSQTWTVFCSVGHVMSVLGVRPNCSVVFLLQSSSFAVLATFGWVKGSWDAVNLWGVAKFACLGYLSRNVFLWLDNFFLFLLVLFLHFWVIFFGLPKESVSRSQCVLILVVVKGSGGWRWWSVWILRCLWFPSAH